MNATELVDLLLEVNVINVGNIDVELNKLASRLNDPRAEKWFKRVPRYFIINIDRLIKEPYVAKAEPRTIRGSKYYANPKGGWVAGQEPEEPETSPLPVRETYDPKARTYTTALHKPVMQKDFEQSFTPFKPKKAKASRLFGEPPTKNELQPWMTEPGAEEKKLYHFDPVQVRRRELYGRLNNLVNYLNYQSLLSTKTESDDPQERVRAAEASKLFQRLAVMKTDDIEGFRDIMQSAYNFSGEVKEKPWMFTKDGQVVTAYNDLTMRKAIFPETVVAFSRRPIEAGDNDEEINYPRWCTKTMGHAESYTKDGPLYFIDKNNRPYVLVHVPSHQVRNVQNANISAEVAHEIAPLFADQLRFPPEEMVNLPVLNREISIPDHSRTVMEFENGWTLKKFTTPFDLAREGAMQQHCCGNTNYQNKLQSGSHSYYSLRDPNNRSIVTIEVQNPNHVLQMKGQLNNVRFSPEIKRMLRQAATQQHWRVEGDYAAMQ